MEQQAASLSDHSLVLQLLQSLDGAVCSLAELSALADTILPFVRRSRLPLEQAVPRIASNYLRDGARVAALLAERESDAWQTVLDQVVTFARTHMLFPKPWETTAWPDLDAYDDIRERLPEYNYDGSLDAWISVIVSSRLRRYWRDSQAISAGGGGYMTPAQRDAARLAGASGSAVRLVSLDRSMQQDVEITLAESLPATMPSVVETVEGNELHRIVAAEVDMLAAQEDPLLADVWHAVVVQNFRLREVAEQHGLTVSQTHRRIERMRSHLRRNPQIRRWFDRGG